MDVHGTVTTTVTRSPSIESEELVVDVDAEEITASVDQESGVMTFSSSWKVMAGSYVATISCADADPLEITINVTAPTVTSLYFSGTQINIQRLNTAVNAKIYRDPTASQGAMTYEIESDYADCYDVVQTPYQSFDSRTARWCDNFAIKQISATGAGRPVNITFTCGEVTKTLPMRIVS